MDMTGDLDGGEGGKESCEFSKVGDEGRGWGEMAGVRETTGK
jgi:hypothetical protein